MGLQVKQKAALNTLKLDFMRVLQVLQISTNTANDRLIRPVQKKV